MDHLWYLSGKESSHDRVTHPPGGTSVRGKQIVLTAAIALAVVLGVKTYEAKKA
jgi:hypothetical protein